MCDRAMPLVITVLLMSSLTWVSGAPADRQGRQTLLRYMFDSLFRQSTQLPSDYESTVDIARKAGFKAEEYTVQTEDGYLLTVHHLPPLPPNGRDAPVGTSAPSSNSTSSAYHKDDNLLDLLEGFKDDPAGLPKEDGVSGQGRPTKVVFLQHGLMGSSDNWNTNAKEDCLAYLLAKAGYDVWMGNFRGNVYSRRHVNMTHADPQFWKFSYDEMAKYDLPVMLDFVLEKTGSPNLHYIGHSMGTTVFFALMSSSPSYQRRVASMIALAPVATVRDIVSPIKYLAPFISEIHSMLRMFGTDQDIVTNRLLISLWDPYRVCRTKGLCENIQFIITGFDPDRANQNMVPMILSHNPAGTSTQTLLHFAQGVNSGTFQKYDLGRQRNLEQYGQEKPPEYDLSALKVPVTLFWAENDWMTGKRDIHHLEKTIPGFTRSHCVENPTFSHLDFLWAKDAKHLVYKRILEQLDTQTNTVSPDTRSS